jgi:hypothetical protein
MKTALLSAAIFLFINTALVGQEAHHDTTLKNVVRINITPMLLTGRPGSITMGYERMLHKRQSISTNIGHLQLPTLITTSEGDPVTWISNERNTGLIGSVDYRFYFSRNKYAKPDGLYWGPYATFYYIDNLSKVQFNGENVAVNGDVQLYGNMLMAGAQLGYQFVLGNRWTIDLILFGPGVGYYNFSVLLDAETQLTGNEEYIRGIYDALITLYPGLKNLIDEDRLDGSGTTSFGGYGFRYVLQVGYRF